MEHKKTNFLPTLKKVIREQFSISPLTSKWGQEKIHQVLGDDLFEDEEQIEEKRKRQKKLRKLEKKIRKAKQKRKALVSSIH